MTFLDEQWAEQKRLYDLLQAHLKDQMESHPPLSRHAYITAMVDVILLAKATLRTHNVVVERDLSTDSYWVKHVRDRAMANAVQLGIFEDTLWQGKRAWKWAVNPDAEKEGGQG